MSRNNLNLFKIMKNFKNSLTRNEMKTIFAGGLGTGKLPFSAAPECGDTCDPSGNEPALTCAGACPKCTSSGCNG